MAEMGKLRRAYHTVMEAITELGGAVVFVVVFVVIPLGFGVRLLVTTTDRDGTIMGLALIAWAGIWILFCLCFLVAIFLDTREQKWRSEERERNLRSGKRRFPPLDEMSEITRMMHLTDDPWEPRPRSTWEQLKDVLPGWMAAGGDKLKDIFDSPMHALRNVPVSVWAALATAVGLVGLWLLSSLLQWPVYFRLAWVLALVIGAAGGVYLVKAWRKAAAEKGVMAWGLLQQGALVAVCVGVGCAVLLVYWNLGFWSARMFTRAPSTIVLPYVMRLFIAVVVSMVVYRQSERLIARGIEGQQRQRDEADRLRAEQEARDRDKEQKTKARHSRKRKEWKPLITEARALMQCLQEPMYVNREIGRLREELPALLRKIDPCIRDRDAGLVLSDDERKVLQDLQSRIPKIVALSPAETERAMTTEEIEHIRAVRNTSRAAEQEQEAIQRLDRKRNEWKPLVTEARALVQCLDEPTYLYREIDRLRRELPAQYRAIMSCLVDPDASSVLSDDDREVLQDLRVRIPQIIEHDEPRQHAQAVEMAMRDEEPAALASRSGESTSDVLERYQAANLPHGDEVKGQLARAWERYRRDKFGEALYNCRMFLETVLRDVARSHASLVGEELDENLRPFEIRRYLEQQGIIKDHVRAMIEQVYQYQSRNLHPGAQLERDEVNWLLDQSMRISEFVLSRSEQAHKRTP